VFRVIQRLRHGCRRVLAAPEWPDYAGADWADTILDAHVADRHFEKQGRSIGRWTLVRGTQTLVVYLKRHYRLPRWQGLLATIFPRGRWSPGWGEHHNLQTATSLGIPVPRVLAAAEYLRPGGHLQSVLAVEELAGMLPLHEAIPLAARRLNPAEFARWKRGLIAEMVRLTRLLHDDHWFHKDLYFCHFYISEGDTVRPPATWKGRVHMIDFHRLQRHFITSPWWQAKDLGQLLYSSEVEGVTLSDRYRFWKLYTQGRSGWLWLVRRMALLRARNHRGHNERKPQTPAKAA
jgi:hypothetical protein